MHSEFSSICLHNMEQGYDNNLQIFLCPKQWLQVKDYLCKAFKKKEQQNPTCLLSKHQQSARTVQEVTDH